MAVPKVDLSRFVTAQEPIWSQVLQELVDGRKRSHWMWFVFPQIIGLGSSPTSLCYAIPSKVAAKQYLAHPVLGARLMNATTAVLCHPDKSAVDIFGAIDALKFRSSMTLFASLQSDQPIFRDALDMFFDGAPDSRTLDILAAQN